MSLRRSFLLSLLEKYSSFLITFISSIVIARLLSPEEIGIFSVTVAFTYLAHMFRDFGVGDYLVKEKNLTKEKIATVFGIAIILAWSVGILLLVAAPYISLFYEEPGIEKVLYILCASFFLIPFSSPILPVLRRNMEFGKLLKINLPSQFMYALSAILLAYNGFSYLSLAWASLVSVATTFLLAQYFRPDETKVMPQIKDFKEILEFGGTVSLGAIIAELGKNAPELIIGKILDFSSVGIFNRGKGLVKLFQTTFLGAISPVIQSEFAEQYRNGRDVKQTYLKSVEYVTVITWPVYAFLAMFSKDIIIILFGDQWVDAAPLAIGFCIPAAIWSLFAFAPKLLIASGDAGTIVKIFSLTEIIRVLFTLIGSLISLEFIVWSFSIVGLLSFLIHSYYLKRYYKIDLIQVLMVSHKSFWVSMLCIILLRIALIPLDGSDYSYIVNMFFLVVVLGVSWLIGIVLLNHPIQIELKKIIEKIR